MAWMLSWCSQFSLAVKAKSRLGHHSPGPAVESERLRGPSMPASQTWRATRRRAGARRPVLGFQGVAFECTEPGC
eukprot:3766400-Pyramimonas_sp.AAC.1